jgi:hypothetical protein
MARYLGTDKELLTMAVVGYEAEKDRIIAAISEIRARIGMGSGAQSAPKRRAMSAAGRKRIAVAQRKRWAALKKSQAQGKNSIAPRKRRLSAAGRRAIIEASRKRWAAYRKGAGKNTKQAA